MKNLLLLSLLMLSITSYCQDDHSKELISNFYRTSPEQILEASRKFIKENTELLFVRQSAYKSFEFLHDSVKSLEIVPYKTGFAIYGVVFTNDIKAVGRMAIVCRYSIEARENRSRFFMEPIYYVSEGGKAECPTSGTLNELSQCKWTHLTIANFKEQFDNRCIMLKKKYKNITSDYLKEDEDRW